MARKISRKGLVKKLDKAFADYIKERDRRTGDICPFCHNAPIENCFHFISRYFRAVRWDAGNAIGSCAGCNIRMEQDPYPFIQYFISRFGQDKWDDLYRRSKVIAKHDDSDLEVMISEYESKRKDL